MGSPFLNKLIHSWDRLQIENHGQYSVERLHRMTTYVEEKRWPRIVTVLILSMLPCLVLNVVLESIPLRPISEGLAGSSMFWIRSTVGLLILSFTTFDQYRFLIPELPTSRREIIFMSLVMAVGTAIGEYLFAIWLGFPVPFIAVTCAPIGFIFATVCVIGSWGRFLLRHKEVMVKMQHQQAIISVNVMLAFIFPAYNYVFVRLSPSQQTWFALLFPVIKLVARNAVSPFCYYIEDFKPEVVIFHLEVFHAFFVSTCMQSSATIRTTMLLMLIDFVHGWLSLRDITVVAKQIEEIRMQILTYQHKQADPQVVSMALSDPITHALFLAKSNPRLQSLSKFRIASQKEARRTQRWSAKSHRTVGPEPAIVPTKRDVESVTVPGFDVKQIAVQVTEDEQKLIVESLDKNDQAKYVFKVLKMLHMVEFMVLVEFTEVVIPFVYGLYAWIAFYMPNRVYNAQLREMDEEKLHHSVGNVLLYETLELLSLVVLQFVLRRKFRVSPVHQLAFVLDTQWTLVQFKLCTWFLYSIQFSIEHFGADYSFKFAWLH